MNKPDCTLVCLTRERERECFASTSETLLKWQEVVQRGTKCSKSKEKNTQGMNTCFRRDDKSDLPFSTFLSIIVLIPCSLVNSRRINIISVLFFAKLSISPRCKHVMYVGALLPTQSPFESSDCWSGIQRVPMISWTWVVNSRRKNSNAIER